jgi:hypothetical protein
VDPNNLRSRRLGVTGKRAFWGSISKLTSASSARTSRKYKNKSNSGKVRVGAIIVLAIVAGALFSGLTVVFPVGLLRHTMGLSGVTPVKWTAEGLRLTPLSSGSFRS